MNTPEIKITPRTDRSKWKGAQTSRTPPHPGEPRLISSMYSEYPLVDTELWNKNGQLAVINTPDASPVSPEAYIFSSLICGVANR